MGLIASPAVTPSPSMKDPTPKRKERKGQERRKFGVIDEKSMREKIKEAELEEVFEVVANPAKKQRKDAMGPLRAHTQQLDNLSLASLAVALEAVEEDPEVGSRRITGEKFLDGKEKSLKETLTSVLKAGLLRKGAEVYKGTLSKVWKEGVFPCTRESRGPPPAPSGRMKN